MIAQGAMSQTPQQFTPAQILEAGQRAEADGQLEYAVQFFRHLTDHLPRTPEAAVARDSVARITGRFPAEKNGFPSGGSPSPLANGAGHSAPKASANGFPNAHGQPAGWAGPGTPSAGPAPIATGGGTMSTPASARPMSGRQGGITVAPVGDPQPRPAYTPNRTRRRYRTGRLAAAVINVLGFVQIGAGFALMAAAIPGLAPTAIAPFVALGLPAGGGLLLAGIFQVFLAQLARALFDSASANRELAAIARWRVAHDGNHGAHRDDSGTGH